jgi:hypothetical protein
VSEQRSVKYRWIDRLFLIHDDELSRVAWSFGYFFFLLSSYFCLRPLREAIAVSTGVGNLQYLFTGTFVTMLAMMPLYGWLVSRLPKHIFLPTVYIFFLANLMVFQVILGSDDPPLAERIQYVRGLGVLERHGGSFLQRARKAPVWSDRLRWQPRCDHRPDSDRHHC